jgi:transposase
MKIKTDSPTSVPSHTLGIDLGDKRHAVCVLDHKTGEILEEFSLANSRAQLDKLALRFPDARIAMEVGTHSPWISRLFQKSGLEVIVANSRKLRAIYRNDRKSD